MTIDIRVPVLGESITEATVGKWYKKAGDVVKVDEPLVELETDRPAIPYDLSNGRNRQDCKAAFILHDEDSTCDLFEQLQPLTANR